MVVVIIIGLVFVLSILLAVYCFKKEKESLGIYSIVLVLFTSIFLYFTIFMFRPSKEDIKNTIDYYNSIKNKIEVLDELDPECKRVIVDVFVPGLKLEVERINNSIEQHKSRIGTWNEYFISKDIANLEPLEFNY